MENMVRWSYSTINTLKQCNRKYYFAQVMATHGRKIPQRRKAYELKKMQNLTMWKGSVVDKFMEKTVIPAIRDKKELDFMVFGMQAVELAKNQFQFSQAKAYNDAGLKKSEADNEFCILDVHELGKPYTEVELAEAYETIKQAVENISLIKMPDGTLLITYLKECNQLVPNVTNWKVEIENARVSPQIDLIAYHNFKPVVIDWKLSDSFIADYSRQLIICGITVYLKRLEGDKQPYQYSDIQLYEVNLLNGVVKQHEFSQEVINDTIDDINRTAKDLGLLHVAYEDADIDEYGLTENEASCKLCSFRPLCIYLLLNQNEYDEESYLEFVQNNQLA